MSFWPRLRRRSRVRKRTSPYPNPYSNLGLDKLAVAQAEFDTQRARFAAEKGVSVSVVRFVSGSARGWTLLPQSVQTPGREDEHLVPSTSSSPTTTSGRREGELPPSSCLDPTPSPESQSSIVSKSEEDPTSLVPSASTGFSTEEFAVGVSPSSSANVAAIASSIASFASPGTGEGKFVYTREYQLWNQVCKIASVFIASAEAFTAAVGVSTALAFIARVLIDSWNRGTSLKRAASTPAAHLIAALRALWSLLQLQFLANIDQLQSPARISETRDRSSPVDEMKVSPGIARETEEESRLSSFAFPVLTRDNSVGTPIFRALSQEAQEFSSGVSAFEEGEASSHAPLAFTPVVTSVKVMAISSTPESPVCNGKPVAQRPCQKLKARIFKSSPGRKITPAASEHSGMGDDAVVGVEVDSTIKSPAAEASSDSPRSKKISFIRRRPNKFKKNTSIGEEHSLSLAESELEEVSSPVGNGAQTSKSQETVVALSPNSQESLNDAAAPGKKMCRSQELKKFSFKGLSKKARCKSQELSPSPASIQELQELALPRESVEGLEALAFPFKEEKSDSSSTCSTPKELAKRRNSLVRLSMESAAAAEQKQGRIVKIVSTPPSRTSSIEKNSIDIKPDLRKAKTSALIRTPLPANEGELARSEILDREVLGSLLILAVLVFLLVGKIPAILATSALCLILSQVQRFFSSNSIHREGERLEAKNDGDVGLSRVGGSIPPNFFNNQGSPQHDLQSSEYRKRVLIGGFLDRGNGNRRPQ